MIYNINIKIKGDKYMGDFSILANRIKELRNKLNLTQKEFSKKVGCTAATLSAYENGSKSPSLEIIKGIAETCDVSIDWLCGLSNEENSKKSIKTYSDIIQILLELSNIDSLGMKGGFCEKYNISILCFNDSVLTKFIKDWSAIKKIYDQKTINDELYLPWIKSKLEEYNKSVKTGTRSYSLSILQRFIDTIEHL